MANLKEQFDDTGVYIPLDEIIEMSRTPREITVFTLLQKIAPIKRNFRLISSAENSKLFLDTDCDLLAESATKKDICILRFCGVCYDSGTNSLFMFV